MANGHLYRQADRDPQIIPFLRAWKAQGRSPCGRGLYGCWSTSNDPNHELDYICCNDPRDCDHQQDGTPFCRDGQAQQAQPGTTQLANGHTSLANGPISV
jgi:hypothetical protein